MTVLNKYKFAKPLLLGLVVILSYLPLYAQTATTTAPADRTAASADSAPLGKAPDEVTNKITNLVDDGKYAEAQQLTTGLLTAYPDDQRLIKAKALIEKLLAPTAANPPAAPGSQPTTPGASTEPTPLTGMDKVDYNALVALARHAQKTTDLDEQRKLLQKFMDERGLFLRKYVEYNNLVELGKQVQQIAGPEEQSELRRQFSRDRDHIVKKHPEQMLLWQISGAAALSLNEPLEGFRAGQWLLAFGAADSNDSGLQSLLSELKNKGWLDRQQAVAAAVAEKYRGVWYNSVTARDGRNEASLRKGCSQEEIDGKKCNQFFRLDANHKLAPETFEISGDGTIKVSIDLSRAECDGDVYGIGQGPRFQDVRWEVRHAGSPARPIWAIVALDESFFEFSCDRPLTGAVDKTRYRYLRYDRSPKLK